jgi:hypothetical protein
LNFIGQKVSQLLALLFGSGRNTCSPNNSLEKPEINNKSGNDFVHAGVFGKTDAFPHRA